MLGYTPGSFAATRQHCIAQGRGTPRTLGPSQLERRTLKAFHRRLVPPYQGEDHLRTAAVSFREGCPAGRLRVDAVDITPCEQRSSEGAIKEHQQLANEIKIASPRRIPSIPSSELRRLSHFDLDGVHIGAAHRRERVRLEARKWEPLTELREPHGISAADACLLERAAQ